MCVSAGNILPVSFRTAGRASETGGQAIDGVDGRAIVSTTAIR
jgi:hypothetical protein